MGQRGNGSMDFLRRQWFPLTAGLLCFLWAMLGWLTVIPNQDILADGIQAQSLLSDPRIVLSFPGQKHGGPLEYPATVLAEWLAPGNYFANAAIRPVLAFFTGAFVALLFRRLFPLAPKWALLTAMAVGPTIIHGLLGPEGNPVGVWWLQPNWDVGWLAVTAGAWMLAGAAGKSWWHSAVGGLLVGLGFFAHPALIIMIVPIMVLTALRTVPSVRTYAWALAGAFLGVLPAAVSYVVNARINTWDPSHGAFIAVDYYLDMGGSVLGLDGVPDYMKALLPYGLGLAPSQGVISGLVQSALMWVFVITISVVATFAVVRAVRARQRVSAAGAVALAWLAVIATLFAFITFVDPVWIYSSGLAILYWLSIGALPSFFRNATVGVIVTAALISLAAISTWSHNATYLAQAPERMDAKIAAMTEQQSIARSLEDAGAYAVFGSYYDAIPVGYASGGDLRTLTTRYNRFPLTDEEISKQRILVGVNAKPTEPWGDEAWEVATTKCTLESVGTSIGSGSFDLFDCPTDALVFER